MSAAAAAAPDGASALAAAIAALPAPVWLHTDMGEETRAKCAEFAAEALAAHKVEKDQAMAVKKALEAWNGALWAVVIGTGFGASIAHENRSLCMFRIGRVHVLCSMQFDEGALINTKKDLGVAAKAERKEDDAPAGADE
jgi:hypothetical protein